MYTIQMTNTSEMSMEKDSLISEAGTENSLLHEVEKYKRTLHH
jgi:hypothetical protein